MIRLKTFRSHTFEIVGKVARGSARRSPSCPPPTPRRWHSALSSICSKQRRPAHLKWLASDSDIAEAWATAINDILKGTTKTPPSKQHADPPPAASEAGDEGEGEYEGCVNRTGSTRNIATGPGRRLLVLVNPASGTGGSLKTWEKTLRSVFELVLVAMNARYFSVPSTIVDRTQPICFRLLTPSRIRWQKSDSSKKNSSISCGNRTHVLSTLTVLLGTILIESTWMRGLPSKSLSSMLGLRACMYVCMCVPPCCARPMLEQALTDITPVISTRAGELAEVVRYAGNRSDHTATSASGSGRNTGVGEGRGAESVVDVGSLDNFDGIVVLGGDGTLFEV